MRPMMEPGNHNINITHSSDQDDASTPVLEDLLKRAEALLSELDIFRNRLRSLRQDNAVETDGFRSSVNSELKMLKRLCEKPNGQSRDHVTRSSNLPFLERVWITVKASRNVVALQRRMYTSPKVKQLSRVKHSQHKLSDSDHGDPKRSVVVDAIVDGGRTWIKVSLITNQRLLFELAKLGWDSGGSEDEEGNFPLDDDDDDSIPLVKTAKALTIAASCFRARTKTPTVHLVLPRIQPGETAEIDNILNVCRATGAILHCSHDVPPSTDINDSQRTMAPDPVESFTSTLNIDCTILLALVSEFSHAKVTMQPWFKTALCRQAEVEDTENLLPSLLYPAMGSHEMVCTKEAVNSMRKIVDTIGSPSEKARTAILLGDDRSKTRAELVHEMQAWSAYPVPPWWQLPIRVVGEDENDCLSRLPPEARHVMEGQTVINRSIFLHGWAAGRTTITSNRVVVKHIEACLEEFEDLDDGVWPSVWLCPIARSLVGKEKRREKTTDGKSVAHHGQAMSAPDDSEEQSRDAFDKLSLKEDHAVHDRKSNGYS